jgi:hypothetical protein
VFGWTAQQLIRRYLTVAGLSLGALAIAYAAALRRSGKKT